MYRKLLQGAKIFTYYFLSLSAKGFLPATNWMRSGVPCAVLEQFNVSDPPAVSAPAGTAHDSSLSAGSVPSEFNEISRNDRDAIFVNAVDPGAPMLRGRTAPFCYRGGEVATIVATARGIDAAEVLP